MSVSIIDKNNILWVATTGAGVLKYDDRKHIFAVNADTLSAIPFLTDVFNSTLFIYSPNPQFEQNETDKAYYNLLGCLLNKFKTDSNLYNRHHYSKELHAFILLLKTKKILRGSIEHITFLIEQSSTMKMLTIKLDDESIEYITPLPFKNSNNENRVISKLIETKQGIIWFGTEQGLFRLDRNNKTWRTWQHESLNKTSLSSNQIFSIAADPAAPDKYLWIGTNGSGLDRLDISANIFTHYTMNEQLPSNVIYGLVHDKSGALWVSTTMGLSKITTQKNTAQISIKSFTTDDGLIDNEFSRYQYAHLNDSELILGGVGGMFKFNTKKLKVESYKSNVEFTALYFYNKLFDFKSDKKIIDCPIQFAPKVVIPPDKNMFTIEFAVIDYIPKNKKRYYYFLEGYTDNWIETVNNANYVTFTNLPAGKYSLSVRATINDGEWNNNDVASINIIVESHWWFKWWFKSIILVCLLACFYLIYKARAIRLGRVKEMRKQIAGDLHDEIGSTLSSVNIASKLMINKMDTQREDLTALISRISDNTNKMMESMNDIVWAIDNKSDELHNVLTRLLNFATETLEPLGCRIELRNVVDLRKIKLNPAEKKNIYLILKEVINNIAKHAAANHILIAIVPVEKNYLMVSIKDNGRGFETDQESNKMSGHGIYSISMRAKEQKWKLTIKSTLGAGTEIEIIMRTHRYHWN
jgi:two-component sensor histidine kinase